MEPIVSRNAFPGLVSSQEFNRLAKYILAITAGHCGTGLHNRLMRNVWICLPTCTQSQYPARNKNCREKGMRSLRQRSPMRS